MPTLSDLSRGFRERYLTHDERTEQLRAWATAFPEVTRLSSLGTTPEGRELWLLTIGRDPDRVRPTAWVDGNMHASELAGASVALAIAEDVLSLLLEGGGASLPAAVRAELGELRFFVLPCMAPDGADAVLRDARYVRSAPRDERPPSGKPRWLSEDIDGDGQLLVMRVADPTGDYVSADPEHPNLLSIREVGDTGPFYRVYPEGRIEPWDGFTIPRPFYLADNPIDLNRNFPWMWAGAHEQVGAGPFPASEPETRAVVAFVSKHPEIFAWCNLHCYGGVFIRPLGHQPDSKMDQEDLGHYRLLEQWAKDHTGYPTVSGYHEFLYAPDQPLHGDVVDFAYHHRGAFAYTVELWDLFHRLDMPKPAKFVDYYSGLTRAQQSKLATWDRDHNSSRVIRPWKRVTHPQLGEVEIGGIDARFGIWNPPPELLGEVCTGQSAVFLRVAALAPRVVLRTVTTTPLGDGIVRIDLHVDNLGYLSTQGLPSAKALDWNEGLGAELVPGPGVALVDPTSARAALGHLTGWGRGVGTGGNELAYLRSPGNSASARASWWVRGTGTVTLTVSGPRTGVSSVDVALGE